MTTIDLRTKRPWADMLGTISTPITGEMIIGIGDFHGHFPALEVLLHQLNEEYTIFQDEDEEVLKSNVTLAFTGDYIDRGNSALKIIAKLSMLGAMNPDRVYTLTGNHELMALADLDIARDILSQISNLRKDKLLELYAHRGQRGSFHGMNGGIDFIKEFGEDSETALQHYVTRMSRDGDIGKWMRDLRPCFLAKFCGKKILFTHADIPDDVATDSRIRSYTQKYLERMLHTTEKMGGSGAKFGDRALILGDSYFWERRFDYLREGDAERLVEKLGVDYIVVGHTVHKGGIKSFDNRIFDIDVGMTPAYGENTPTAIVFKNKGVYSFDVEDGEKLLVEF